MTDRYLTSPTLLKRLANLSDQDAWTHFVDLYGPLIARFVARHERSELEIEDAVQRVCIRVLEVISKFQYDQSKGRFRSWLGVVTMNEIRNRHAAKQRRPTVPLTDNESAAAVEAEWEDEFKSYVYERAVETVRQTCSAETWHAFEEQWAKGRSPSELAKEMNRSDTWVYQAKSNVLKHLREEVERLSDDSGLFLRPN